MVNNSKCDTIYENVVNLSVSSSDSLFQLAQCFMSGFSLERLREMLRSQDIGVVLDGLFVCKEIGRLVCAVRECVEPLVGSNDKDARKMAEEVISICQIYEC